MYRPWNLAALTLLVLIGTDQRAVSQSSDTATNTPAYRLAVDEVALTFHASDARGVAVNDVKLGELTLLDNGKPPRRVVDFHMVQDEPIRAGILIDTSESMEVQLAVSRAIASQYAQRILRQQTDQAFVIDFGYVSRMLQPWTNKPDALVAGISQAVAGKDNPLGGTALFDSIFRACFNLFGKVDHAASGNFILLLSDGVDNASHTSLDEVVDTCQRAHTAIYAFRISPSPGLFSGGPRTLADLAAQTGGRIFPGNESKEEIESNLSTIEGDLRNQYRLVFNPAGLTHDGTFHRIRLVCPARVDSVVVRDGYYDRLR